MVQPAGDDERVDRLRRAVRRAYARDEDEPRGGPWTSHGHSIDGVTVAGAGRPPIKRCGGPGMCRTCSVEAERIRAECRAAGVLDEQRPVFAVGGVIGSGRFRSRIVVSSEQMHELLGLPFDVDVVRVGLEFEPEPGPHRFVIEVEGRGPLPADWRLPS